MKKSINQITSEKLHSMDLSERAAHIVADTDINVMYEVFGGLETPEEVEKFIEENFTERFYIIGTDGCTYGEADTREKCEAILADVNTALRERYDDEYVESLELEIVSE